MEKEQKPGSGGNAPGEKLYHRVRRFIEEEEMIRPGEAVVAGVSGGADSLCLFQVLLRLSQELGFLLEAVHVHHGLREAADTDLVFVEDLCREAGIPCSSVRADAAAMARQWGTGVEEAGRRLRYAAFEERAAKLEAERQAPCRIAVAHHREDQAETLLFHLCRGTDLRGAGGMRPVQGRIIRPLLRESREAIENYLLERGMAWRTDETNADTSYSRNYLRKEVLPRLAEGVNPAASERIARFAHVCAEAERYLEKMTREALERCAVPAADHGDAVSGNAVSAAEPEDALPEEDASAAAAPAYGSSVIAAVSAKASPVDGSSVIAAAPALRISALRREDPFMQGRLLYSCLAEAAGRRRDLQAVHIEALRKLCGEQYDWQLSMPGRIRAVRRGDRLVFAAANGSGFTGAAAAAGCWPVSAEDYACRVFAFDGDLSAIPRNEYTKWFDYDKIGMFPVFRTRQPGDTMHLRLPAGDGRQGAATADGGSLIAKKLARIMLDSRIPAEIRDRIVLPFAGKEALWIPGVRMGDCCKVSGRTGRILAVTLRDCGQSARICGTGESS